MDSTEPREPSYYEVALTHRQVLVAFVVLLTCLLAAFLSGVWVGRGAEPAARVATSPPASPGAAAPIEQLTFFAGKEPGTRGPGAAAEAAAPKPAPARSAAPATRPAEDAATEAMRRTLEAEMEAHRDPAPSSGPAAAPAAPAALAPGERARQASAPAPPPTAAAAPAPKVTAPAAAPAPKVAAPAAAPAGSIWIQVYSSANGTRAREIGEQLRKARFPVVVAELARDGQSAWRVRVGPYPTRAQADTAAARLRREQKLDTWVTDTP